MPSSLLPDFIIPSFEPGSPIWTVWDPKTIGSDIFDLFLIRKREFLEAFFAWEILSTAQGTVDRKLWVASTIGTGCSFPHLGDKEAGCWVSTHHALLDWVQYTCCHNRWFIGIMRSLTSYAQTTSSFSEQLPYFSHPHVIRNNQFGPAMSISHSIPGACSLKKATANCLVLVLCQPQFFVLRYRHSFNSIAYKFAECLISLTRGNYKLWSFQ